MARNGGKGALRASLQEDFEPLYTDADRTGFLVGPWANAAQRMVAHAGYNEEELAHSNPH
jgi:hypothetical protein